MILTLLLRYWKHIILLIAVVTVLGLVYNAIYQRGVAATTQTYELKIAEQQKLLDTKVATLELLSTQLVTQTALNQQNLNADLAKILAAAKTKPLVVYKNGECSPSQTFLDSWNQINLRGNQK